MAAILTENSIAGDRLIFDDIIGKAYKHAKNTDTMALLRRMVDDGVIQMDALFEKAVSVVGQLERISAKGKDYPDGSDAKKVTTTWRITYPSHTNTYVNPQIRRVGVITGLKHKRGVLRCIMAETVSNKIYYFRIPYKAYQGLRTVCLYFNKDGSPKLDGKFWKYKCDTFSEMAS